MLFASVREAWLSTYHQQELTMKTETTNKRFVCDNWDNPEVKLESGGKGKAPVRKVVTKPKLNTSEINRLGITDT